MGNRSRRGEGIPPENRKDENRAIDLWGKFMLKIWGNTGAGHSPIRLGKKGRRHEKGGKKGIKFRKTTFTTLKVKKQWLG